MEFQQKNKQCLFLSFSDNDDICPVKTFMKLTRKLHPGCPYLFQRVAKNVKDNVWFDSAIGT
jgi:hypothetical protein